VTEVRGADPRSRQNRHPDGVACSFQVRTNNVEPRVSKRRRNLLAKKPFRSAGHDEAEEIRPEVALVVEAALLSGVGEGLAGAASGPHGLVVGPPGEAEGVRPSCNPGEEMGLCRRATVGIDDVFDPEVPDAAFTDDSRGDVPGGDEVADPCGRIRIQLVVEGGR
jgi:hypothetical protein